MQLTEHQLTAALTGTAKTVMAARKKVRKSGIDIDTAWDAMDRYEKFKLLDALGSQILPVLTALPDIEVPPGTRPSYRDQQVREIVAGLVDDSLGKLQRAVVVKTRTALVQRALANVPPRLDPETLGTTQDS
jgi:hypothetical protein